MLQQSTGVTSVEPLPSTAIMFFAYHLVSVEESVSFRPVMAEEVAIEYLKKLQYSQNSSDQAFFLQLWIGGLTGLAEACSGFKCKPNSPSIKNSSLGEITLWKSFVLVKVPHLIEKLESRKLQNSILEKDMTEIEDTKNRCHELVINQLFGFCGLISACNQQIEKTSENTYQVSKTSDISVDILKVCLKRSLIRREFVVRLLKERSVELEWEGMDATDSDVLTEKILADPLTVDHLVTTVPHYFSHESCVETVMKLVTTWSSSLDLHPLAMLCRALIDNPVLLDLVHLYRHPSLLLRPLIQLCNTWKRSSNSLNTIASYQEDYENFGAIFLFVNTVIFRYELHTNISDIDDNEDGFFLTWLRRSSFAFPLDSLTTDQRVLVTHWLKVLSLGKNHTPDDLIRESEPRKFIQVSPTIFQKHIKTLEAEGVDGIKRKSLTEFEIFLHPCWSFTLVGLFQWLCNDASMKGPLSFSFQVITTLLSCPKFPSSVLRLIGNRVIDVIKKFQEPAQLDDKIISLFEEKILNVTSHPEWLKHKYPAEMIFGRFRTIFKSIVNSGRRKFVKEDSRNNSLGLHHFDINLFRDVLLIGGPQVFVQLIVEEVLNLGKLKVSLRAAELGASLIMTQLSYSDNPHLHPPKLIHILFTDCLTSAIDKKIESYAQGGTLGMMTSYILLRVDASITIRNHTLYQHFSENILSKFQISFEEKNLIDYDYGSNQANVNNHQNFVSKYSPIRGFAAGLISHREIYDKLPEMVTFLEL
ncbi:hypothetical protein G9A89_006835 [Geosiphon pyriformis]|nr:hypothetical protein G9A89_006835 [Geosiphon pyriformis]